MDPRSQAASEAIEEKYFLKNYQDLINHKIRDSIPSLSSKNLLRDACEYALTNAGKRFRPALVMMMAKALDKKSDVTQAALAIEFFHTASLVADDLPCMDDEEERRQKPTLHKVYGEAATLLVSYALIAAGYACLVKNAEDIRAHSFSLSYDQICSLALENAAHNTGLQGATS